ncbi:WecB/TagA/CpsF family glycosyltransferase [Haematospirillum jordaniae]|uniref:WecB/TagA/CpsF family glycosyltransferase n=1 Tax=Haematospirillum jordaniae TaxID=1549855 RepID=UPI0014333312|nr:WecB/TagA/CpsF family glycosyltransferase [Haematospirillum jordaniae]NKD45566.1 WecB/TagA/CpsF family glycosyltransferase [Haematospirillum jordaniae]NKD91037.1 WecB/TagA/CpsF family glycosyltransferase [Haematospirillum jordaniae]
MLPTPVSAPRTRMPILGCPLSLFSPHQASRQIVLWARGNPERPALVLFRDVHSLLAGRDIQDIRQLEHLADLVLPDGMPLVWIARTRGYSSARRAYGPDIMHILCSLRTQSPLRHAFLGGAPGVAEKLATSFPNLSVAGMLAPNITDGSRLDLGLVQRLNAMNADLLWVGLGTPKQDLWIATHHPYLNAKVILGVGAAFNFLAGTVRQAPRFLHPLGLEWLWRMAMEPRRLIPRYVKTIPRFSWLVFRELCSIQRR